MIIYRGISGRPPELFNALITNLKSQRPRRAGRWKPRAVEMSQERPNNRENMRMNLNEESRGGKLHTEHPGDRSASANIN